jgi:CheY-like chemotaxis protein
LLDLNLPKMSGYEVLQALKEDRELCQIPVLVLSGSEAEHDVVFCYRTGACAYLVKPGSPEVAQRLIRAIEAVWFTLGRTPRSA